MGRDVTFHLCFMQTIWFQGWAPSALVCRIAFCAQCGHCSNNVGWTNTWNDTLVRSIREYLSYYRFRVFAKDYGRLLWKFYELWIASFYLMKNMQLGERLEDKNTFSGAVQLYDFSYFCYFYESSDHKVDSKRKSHSFSPSLRPCGGKANLAPFVFICRYSNPQTSIRYYKHTHGIPEQALAWYWRERHFRKPA